MAVDVSVRIGKLKLKNPVMVASGTFGYGEEFSGLANVRQLGAIVSKTITLNARPGNPPPRTCETPAGMLNSIGLENPGLEHFIDEKLPYLAKTGTPVIVSIASEQDPIEFVTLCKKLDKLAAVSAVELNISCPNVRKKTLISQDANATYAVVRAVRRVTRKTVITKLSPNVTDIVAIAQAAERGGSDALALINTVSGMSVDVNSRKPKIAMVSGGLSGPAIRPVAVRMVWEAYQSVQIPIIGMGGICDAASALEFFIAGAAAISVGTANFINPGSTSAILAGLKKYLQEHKFRSIFQLTGSLVCQS